MATCTASVLTADARCLVQGMSNRQLLASILCVLATANSMACDPATLVASSKCLWESMNERQLLASIALTLCEGGGGGGGTPQVFQGSGPPSGLQAGQNGALAAVYYDIDEGYLAYPWSIADQNWVGI